MGKRQLEGRGGRGCRIKVREFEDFVREEINHINAEIENMQKKNAHAFSYLDNE